MRSRLIAATAMALMLVAAPAASAQGPPEQAGPPDTLPEQAENRAGNASQGQDNASQGRDNASQGHQTADDARANGRDHGLDRAQANVDANTPEHAGARDAIDRARQQPVDDTDLDDTDLDDTDLDDTDLDDTETQAVPDQVDEARDGAFQTVLDSLGSALQWIVDAASGAFDSLQLRLTSLFA